VIAQGWIGRDRRLPAMAAGICRAWHSYLSLWSRQTATSSAADAFGFMCGKRNGITVLDVDTTDERVLADAIDRHGKTPIIARSASGHFQAWYRHNGERRRIRPRRDVPIDILGGGYVVAPPSRVERGEYQFLEGSVDDVASLPTLKDAPAMEWSDIRPRGIEFIGEVKQGERNKKLFGLCLHAARHCDDFDTLCDVARTRNSEFVPPLDDGEVIRAATSAWKYEVEGRNYSGGRRAVFSTSEVLPMMPDPYVGMLRVWARANFKPDSHFWIADGLADKFGWSNRQLRQARKRAIDSGVFRLIAPRGNRRPAIYGFGSKRLEREEGVS
jgi:hypothetical protein